MIQVMTDNPLHRLTPAQRRMLRVIHECGWNYKLAARRLEVAVPSIRTAVHRAMRDAGVEDRAILGYLLCAEDVHTGRIDPARPLEPLPG